MTYDVETLSKRVTLEEFETGRDLFNLLRERGFSAAKAAGIVYRAGRQDMSRERKDKYGRELTRLHGIINELKQSQPEATTTKEEGEVDHE